MGVILVARNNLIFWGNLKLTSPTRQRHQVNWNCSSK